MDLEEKKKLLTNEFKVNRDRISALAADKETLESRNLEIIGKLKLLDELIKEES